MGYVIRGRTNHKSALTLHFSLSSMPPPHMSSPREPAAMFSQFGLRSSYKCLA